MEPLSRAIINRIMLSPVERDHVSERCKRLSGKLLNPHRWCTNDQIEIAAAIPVHHDVVAINGLVRGNA
jgi:hypothetical protein